MAKLTLSRKGQPDGAYSLTGTDYLLGSNPDCAIRLPGAGILPRHARITCNAGRYRIAAGAGAGLHVNQHLAGEHDLHDGDVIQLGDYTLTFRDDSRDSPAQPSTAATQAWLQVLNGRHRGRIILLQEAVTRFGMAGDLTVMISRRNNGYYLSHLEGEAVALVNQTAINDTVWPLHQGDTIHMGKLRFGFFVRHESDGAPGADSDRQRHCARVSLHSPAIITGDRRRWETRLIDLSLSGALLEHPSGWDGKTGDCFRLNLQLAGHSGLEVAAEVRQIMASRLGMAFVDLDDTGRNEIRRLMENNLGDTGLLQPGRSEFA
jgi:hypothetical protein